MSSLTKVPESAKRPDSASLIGVKARTSSDLIVHIEKGLPYTALERLGETTGLTTEQVRAGIGMSGRTHARRRKDARNLSSEQSDRLVRISRVFALAIDLFEGDRDAARQWFLAANRAFNDKSPYEMVRTEVGARETENLIGRLENGVFS